MNIEIIPAIVPRDRIRMTEQLSCVRGFTQTVQIDITDGVFTPHTTLQSADIPESLTHGLSCEIHIMAAKAEDIAKEWIGRSPKRIILHAESKPSALLIQEIQHEGIEPVLALAAPSELILLEPYVHLVQSVLFLSIDPPGDQGKPFLPDVMKKMHDFHVLHPSYTIEADGGIGESTMGTAIKNGATQLVVGSGLFSSRRPPDEQFAYLTQLARQYADEITHT